MEKTSPNQNPPGNGSGIDLYVTVKDKDGNVINEQCKNGDLYLYNWAVCIANFLKYGFNSGAAKTYYGILRTGVQTPVSGTVCGAQTYWSSIYRGQWAGLGKIVLGASQQAPTIRDYNLLIPIVEITPLAPSIESAGNTLKVIITGTTLFAVQTVIGEAGLSITAPWNTASDPNHNGSSYPFLITRDIFTPVTVPEGGSITIRFELWFNAMPE